MLLLVTGYIISNICAYVALQRIDAAVYTVLGQLKLFTTAMFSICFLGTHISGNKHRALVMLALGCILVTSPNFNTHQDCDATKVGSGGKVDDAKVTLM